MKISLECDNIACTWNSGFCRVPDRVAINRVGACSMNSWSYDNTYGAESKTSGLSEEEEQTSKK